MKPGAARAALLAFSGMLAVASHAAAQPSLWDVAKDPNVGRSYEALVRGEQLNFLLDQPIGIDVRLGLDERIHAAFAEAHELDPTDSRTAILLAQHAAGLDGLDYKKNRDIAFAAIARDPSSPRAAEAWFSIGILSAKLEDRDVELDAYTRALELEWRPISRGLSYLNRAESHMIAGRFEQAIADYQRSLEASSRPDSYSLAHWGLAIAHERHGDLPSALEHAAVARNVLLPPMGINPIDLSSVFFVPEYDRYYYKALGSMAAARAAKKPRVEEFYVLDALRNWVEYIAAAEPDGQPWVKNAERHRQRLERRLAILHRKREAKPAAEKSPPSRFAQPPRR